MVLALVLFFLLGASRCAHAADVRKDLDVIKEKINREQRTLSQLKTQEGSVLDALAQVQKNLAQRKRELQTVHEQLSVLNQKFTLTQRDAAKIAASLQSRKKLLAQRAVALYRWQRGGSPMMILNGELNLAAFMRRRTYLEATMAFDQTLIAGLADESKELAAVQRAMENNRQAISAKKEEVAKAMEAVQADEEKKRVLLASLRREKSVRSKALQEMEQAAAKLQRIIDELARRAVVTGSGETKRDRTALTSVPGSRGHMEWPVRGKLLQGFGKSKHPVFAAEVFRNGIDIDAPMGDPIKAVERGRVVFASRLAGYGNMIVVDHGQRFFTIYGHLSEMAKKNGDSVDRGEVLGRVGDSDSIEGAKLYFEMRREGRPVDPVPWLREQ